jgi:dipeptidyl aminopeptidase/acylaminoacyl peptidase
MLAELDENVFPASTLQVVDALVKADRDFEMYYFPNDGHRFRTPFAIRKTWDYLVRYLHGQEPPEYHIRTTD